MSRHQDARWIRAVTKARLAAVVAGVGLATSVVLAQRRGGDAFYRLATPESFDGAFNFCRIAFRNTSNGDGNGWQVDYPRADLNLSTRLSELTKAPISRDDRGEPNHLLVRLIDAELFKCPFVMMTEPGGAFLDESEAAHLRDYLLKGGFLWVDDFWGEYAWSIWESQLRKALPSGSFPIKDLPIDHSLFHMVFRVNEVPQIPSINAWRGSGGGTSERVDSQVPHARAIVDERDRIIVLMTHNTDIGDSWERETDDPEYFERFSVYGYAFGVNVIVYAMTH
jgi:hypothetical protein